jgi:TP901-1 family phage major tail protein
MPEQRVSGKKIRLLVFDGQYVRMLGQTEVSVNRSKSRVEGEDVDSLGWPDPIEGSGQITGSVTLNGQMIKGDRAFAALDAAFVNDTFIKVARLIEFADGTVKMDGGLVTVDAANEGGQLTATVTYSITLNFAGVWEPISLS